MVKIMRIVVRAFISFAFICSGMMKLTDKLNPKMHNHMAAEFRQFSKVHPFALAFGYVPEPRTYMQTIGVLEVVGAVLLLLGNTRCQTVSSLLLMFIMAGGIFTHVMMGHKFGQMVPAGVLFLLLLAHLFRISTDVHTDTKKKE